MIKAFLALIAALPEILKLIKMIQDAMKEQEIQGKVKDGVKQIHEALVAGDSDKLNSILSSKPK